MSKKKQRFITNWLKAFIGGESDQRKTHERGGGGGYFERSKILEIEKKYDCMQLRLSDLDLHCKIPLTT